MRMEREGGFYRKREERESVCVFGRREVAAVNRREKGKREGLRCTESQEI